MNHLEIRALPDIPDVTPGTDIGQLVLDGMELAGLAVQSGDVFAISSKIVSKSENRYIDLTTVQPTEKAHELAELTHKDPRIVQVVLRESTMISRAAPHVLVVRHRLGYVCANAGIDQSNVGQEASERVLLLPEDPDASARQIAEKIQQATGQITGVIITDTHGRPFRMGNINIALGVSGVPAILDQRGHVDRYGRELEITMTASADQLASAAGLLMGEAAEGQPIAMMRGVQWDTFKNGTGQDLIRSIEKDLYLKD